MQAPTGVVAGRLNKDFKGLGIGWGPPVEKQPAVIDLEIDLHE